MSITPAQLKYATRLLVQYGQMENRADILRELTEGRTASLRELTKAEAQVLIQHLAGPEGQKEDRQRKKMIALAREMQWDRHPETGIPLPDAEFLARLDNWCAKFGQFKKPLNAHTWRDLPKLLTQFERVHKSFLKSL